MKGCGKIVAISRRSVTGTVSIYCCPMLQFFQKIRRAAAPADGGRNYTRYAFGELLLVIMGILIALQINNWNDERIEQRQIEEYAHSLIQDLERDVAMAQTVRSDVDLILKKIDTLADYTRGKSADEMRNIDLFYLMRRPFYRPYAWNRTALEQMKSSGALRQMRNRKLAAAISAYEALTHHLDDDFEFDRTVGATAISLARQVVDMNYPALGEVVPVNEDEVFSFPNSNIHAAYEQIHLSLLTRDVEKIGAAVNGYLILADKPGIRPRTQNEMPELIASAQELILLLRAEYPD